MERRKENRIIFVSVVIFFVISFLLCGLLFRSCSNYVIEALFKDYEGRDWSIPLNDHYTIVHINGHEIVLIYKHDPESASGKFVISNYFIKEYCTNEQFIGLKGIPTENSAATDEELQNGETVFYIVEFESGTVYGPFAEETAYRTMCRELGISGLNSWQDAVRPET